MTQRPTGGSRRATGGATASLGPELRPKPAVESLLAWHHLWLVGEGAPRARRRLYLNWRPARYRVPPREPILLGPDATRRVGVGERALPLVHAPAPPRQRRQVCAVHQAGRAGMRPRRRMGRAAFAVRWRGKEADFEGRSRKHREAADGAEEEIESQLWQRRFSIG